MSKQKRTNGRSGGKKGEESQKGSIRSLEVKQKQHVLVLLNFLLHVADLRGDVLKRVLEVGILHLQLCDDLLAFVPARRARDSIIGTIPCCFFADICCCAMIV